MLEEYQKFKMLDLSGKGNHFFIEVNWNPEDEKTNQCKVLKVTFPNGDTAFIKKELLLSLLWVIGKRSEQRKMIPQKITKVRHYITTLWVQIKQDMKKGDILKIPVNISLPAVSEEVIAELKKDAKKLKVERDPNQSQIIVPDYINAKKKTK